MKKVVLTALVAMFLVSFVNPVSAATQAAPAQLQSALILKLLPYYQNLGDKNFTIHVVGSEDIAKKLRENIGVQIGKATLVNVTTGDTPINGAAVVYIAKGADALNWTQKNKVLSVSGDPNMVSQGVTLGISLEDGKPKVFLNLRTSKAEGADWNSAILKVAETSS